MSIAAHSDPNEDSRLIFLAGPVTHWWGENWATPEHWEYVAWRDQVRDALIRAGYLTYAPHEAIKGAWASRAQAINNAAIAASDLMLDMTPIGTPSAGTDAEARYAEQVGTHVLWVPPATLDSMLNAVAETLEYCVPKLTQEGLDSFRRDV